MSSARIRWYPYTIKRRPASGLYRSSKCDRYKHLAKNILRPSSNMISCESWDLQHTCAGTLQAPTDGSTVELDAVPECMQSIFLPVGQKKLEIQKNFFKAQPEILNLRFDSRLSPINAIPVDLRRPLLKIFLEYAEGTLRRSGKRWLSFDPLADPDTQQPFPFEIASEDVRISGILVTVDSNTKQADNIERISVLGDMEDKKTIDSDDGKPEYFNNFLYSVFN